MSEPAVDIVLPTNRDSAYLRDALASVRDQTWTSWRVIVVDNRAEPSQALERLVGETVPDALVLRRCPKSPGAARNTGLGAVTGDLVAFLDDDDVWHPERLERQVRAWQQDPDAVGVFSGGWYIDSDGTPFGDGWPASPTASTEFLRGSVPIPRIVTLLLRRDVCESLGGFDESFQYGEDDELILRVLQRGELVAVPEQLVGYRRHADNATNAPLLTLRASSQRLIGLQIDRARRTGRPDVVRLLHQNRRRFLRGSAEECVGSLVAAVRGRRWHDAGAELRWAATQAPLRTLAATARRSAGRASRPTASAGGQP